jgi:hypothetical protein
MAVLITKGDWDSGVDIATSCTVRGSNPVWEGDFLFATLVQNGTGSHPESYTMNIEAVSCGQSGWGVAFITHPHLRPRFRVGTAVSLLLLSAFQEY